MAALNAVSYQSFSVSNEKILIFCLYYFHLVTVCDACNRSVISIGAESVINHCRAKIEHTTSDIAYLSHNIFFSVKWLLNISGIYEA